MHYNPFSYVHSEKDILKLVTTLMTNTKGEGSGGDPFWEKSERLLLTALIAYLHYEAPVEEQNFATLLEMLNTMQVLEDDEEYQNPVDLLFEDVHGACLAPELIDQFVEVVTPIGDYTYRWKLNTGRKKSKDERTDLMAVTDSPILAFTIDFETAKRYREANKMPHQFRRAAWTDLTVEVYL